MNHIDEFKILVGGYFGIREMDEYNLKEYVLKEIEDYIKRFLKLNPLFSFDYDKEIEEIEKLSLKRKLQDSLLVLNKIDGPFDLKLMIKQKLQKLNSSEH